MVVPGVGLELTQRAVQWIPRIRLAPPRAGRREAMRKGFGRGGASPARLLKLGLNGSRRGYRVYTPTGWEAQAKMQIHTP